MQPWYTKAVAEPSLAIAAAAESDLDAARFLDHNEQMRVEGYGDMINFLRAEPELRPGLTPERATDLMLLLVGPAAYRALVAARGWSHAEWVSWTTNALVEQVFGVHDREAGPESPG